MSNRSYSISWSPTSLGATFFFVDSFSDLLILLHLSKNFPRKAFNFNSDLFDFILHYLLLLKHDSVFSVIQSIYTVQYCIVHMFQSTFKQSFFIIVSRCLQNTNQSAGAHIHTRAHTFTHTQARFTLLTLNPNPLFVPIPPSVFYQHAMITSVSMHCTCFGRQAFFYNSLYWENCPTPQLSATKENKQRYLPPHPPYLHWEHLSSIFSTVLMFNILLYCRSSCQKLWAMCSLLEMCAVVCGCLSCW